MVFAVLYMAEKFISTKVIKQGGKTSAKTQSNNCQQKAEVDIEDEAQLANN